MLISTQVDASRERVEVARRDVLDEPLVPLGRGVRRRGRDVRPSLYPRIQRALPREPRVREQLERHVRHVGPCPLARAEVARWIPVEVRVRQQQAALWHRCERRGTVRREDGDGGEVQRRPENRHSRSDHTNAERQGHHRQRFWSPRHHGRGARARHDAN